MSLKTDYKDAIPPSTGRVYRPTYNSDGTMALEDVTEYQQVGDSFGAVQLNALDAEVNQHKADTENPHGVTAAEVGAEPAFSKNNAFNKSFGSAAGTVCQGNDTRLSNSRRASNITMSYNGNLYISYS